MYMLELGYCGDSVTIVIISVTIMTVIAKAYCRDSGHVVTGMCIWHLSPQQTHNHMKKREDGKKYFWWDWSWQRAGYWKVLRAV